MRDLQGFHVRFGPPPGVTGSPVDSALVGVLTSVRFSSRHLFEGPCGPYQATIGMSLGRDTDVAVLRQGSPATVLYRGRPVLGGKISSTGSGTDRVLVVKSWSQIAWDAATHSADPPGTRLGRDAENRAYTPTNPTTPRWMLDASVLPIEVAQDRLYSRVVATYQSGTTSGGAAILSTVTSNSLSLQAAIDVITYELDLTGAGVISSTVAQGYADAQLAEFGISEWTGSVQVSGQSLRSMSGWPAEVHQARAGDMVRLVGLGASFRGARAAAATDVVLGEVEWASESPRTVTLSPQRTAPRRMVDVIRELARRTA